MGEQEHVDADDAETKSTTGDSSMREREYDESKATLNENDSPIQQTND